MRGRALRAGAWLALTGVVTLVARTLAYALAPSSAQAAQLNGLTGGPRLVTVSLVAVALAFVASAAGLWLAVVGVRERRRLRPERIAPPEVSLTRVGARALALCVSVCTLFAGFESYLHERAGLGFHGISCLAGPVHRNVIPIAAALSLVAAALAEALGHVLAWMHAAIRLLRTPPPRRAVARPRVRRPVELVAPRTIAAALVAQPRAPPLLAPSL